MDAVIEVEGLVFVEADAFGVGPDRALDEKFSGQQVQTILFQSQEILDVDFRLTGDFLEGDAAEFPFPAEDLSQGAHVQQILGQREKGVNKPGAPSWISGNEIRRRLKF